MIKAPAGLRRSSIDLGDRKSSLTENDFIDRKSCSKQDSHSIEITSNVEQSLISQSGIDEPSFPNLRNLTRTRIVSVIVGIIIFLLLIQFYTL